MVMRGIDLSNHQGGIDFQNILALRDFVILKATEGLTFVDPWCDIWAQSCIAAGKPWGYYHFARNNDPREEARFFLKNTEGYTGKAIPVLDWEDGQSVEWVNEFVDEYHASTGIWPMIYANPWRFLQGGVNTNCARWVAAYPGGMPEPDACPSADIPVTCWQYTSTPYDYNYFYGDAEAWQKIATGGKEGDEDMTPEQNDKLSAIYNEVTRTDDPTGRGQLFNDHDHIKWLAAELNGKADGTPGIRDLVEQTLGVVTQLVGQMADVQDRLDAIEDELSE